MPSACCRRKNAMRFNWRRRFMENKPKGISHKKRTCKPGRGAVNRDLKLLLMKPPNSLLRNWPMTLLYLGAMALVITGCCSAKPKEAAIHQRGWIGGEYKIVGMFPAGLKHKQHSAVLVTALNTNTPASLAGLNEGDLIVELNHQPAAGIKRFRRT